MLLVFPAPCILHGRTIARPPYHVGLYCKVIKRHVKICYSQGKEKYRKFYKCK